MEKAKRIAAFCKAGIVFCIVYLLFAVAFEVFEVCGYSSLAGFIFGKLSRGIIGAFRFCCFSRLNGWLSQQLPKILALLDPVTIQAVVKTIGVGSILVAWIYAALDKRELGVRYSDFIDRFCNHYHIFTIVYIFSVLICVWLTGCGMVEAGVASMLLVLLGIALQAAVFIGFVQDKDQRKKYALEYWEQKMQGSLTLEEIANLENNILFDDSGTCDKMCTMRNSGLIKYMQQHKECAILDLSYSWENLLRGKNRSQQMLLIHSSYREICDRKRLDKENIFIFCSSYIFWRYREQNIKLNSWQDSPKLIHYILEDVQQIREKLTSESETRDCMELVYNLLAWTCFFSRKSSFFNSQLNAFMQADREFNNNNEIKKQGKKLVQLILREDFSRESKYHEHIYEMAWRRSVVGGGEGITECPLNSGSRGGVPVNIP